VVGSINAFDGVLKEPTEIMVLDDKTVAGIHKDGGTIIGTTNKGGLLLGLTKIKMEFGKR
jgi:6-phosphofructokinase 1